MRKILFFLLLIPFVCYGQPMKVIGRSPFYIPPTARGFGDIINDGNTWAQYIADDDYLTKDAQDSVSVWADAINSHDLAQTDGTGKCPIWSGDSITFNGTSQFMQAADDATLTQPITVYIVFDQLSYTSTDCIFEGKETNYCKLYQSSTGTNIRAIAGGSAVSTAPDLALNAWGVLTVIFNGESSSISTNNAAPVTGNMGANAMGGFIIGSGSDGTGLWANISVGEIIIRKIVDSAGDQTIIYNYLAAKYL